jgi:hypothetical protein
MTINFFEPGDVPKPREEIKIELLEVETYPDRQRIRLKLNVTPFQERPSLEVTLTHKNGIADSAPVASLSIVETMHPRMEFTMHIRTGGDPAGEYNLRAVLYFRAVLDQNAETLPPIEAQDVKEISVTIPEKS